MRTIPAKVLVLVLLTSIQLTACAGRNGPIGSYATLDPARLSTMLDDVRKVEVDSNVGRREALEAILSESGVAYELEPFTIEPRENYPRTEGANLVITLGEGESDIIVGAHYDAVWLRDGTLSRGAVDNAASSVVLARLAETLKDDPIQHRIRIVLFDMEEIGLVGSAKYIEDHESDTIAAAVNLDVNGYGDTLMFGPAAGGGNADVYQLFKETCVEEQLDCQEFDQYPPSDNLSFQAAGIPNISIGVLPAAEAHQMWLFMNSDTEGIFPDGFTPNVLATIHTPNDTSDSVESAAMELSYRAALGLVRKLDALVVQ